MNTYRVILQPRAPVKTVPTSNILFGVFCWAKLALFPNEELKQWLNEFKEEPEFILSSCFPVINHRKSLKVFFYPMPILPEIPMEEFNRKYSKDLKSLKKALSRYKKFKKARYVSESVFTEILRGADILEIFDNTRIYPESPGFESYVLTEDKFLNKKDELKPSKTNFISHGLSQKNMVDRLFNTTAGSGQLFYEDSIMLKRNITNFYFLIKTTPEVMENQVLPILKYLNDSLIAGDSYFVLSDEDDLLEPVTQEFFTVPNQTKQKFVTLSPYLPVENEIEIKESYYDILPYWGRVHNSLRWESKSPKTFNILKDRIIFLQEGSVFYVNSPKRYYGKLQKVWENEEAEKKVYQYGMAFPAFFNTQEGIE